MSKAFDHASLADLLDSDLNWRIREISALKLVIKDSGPSAENALLRSLVPMLYAHWEGHVRFCATQYFKYVTKRKLKFSELSRQMYINRFIKRFDNFYHAKIPLSIKSELISDILDSGEARFSRIDPDLIDTKSNLSSHVLKDICVICGVKFSHLEKNSDFIDTIILKRRNSIAHGEEVYIKKSELDELTNGVIDMMRSFKGLLQNQLYTDAYKAR